MAEKKQWVRCVLVMLLVGAFSTLGYSQELGLDSRGPEVEDLQVMLTRLGYYDGLVDGYFGPATQQAVRNFQRAWALEDDGVVGKETWYWLNMAVTRGERRYQVREGDTLELICRRFNVSRQDLLTVNPSMDPHKVKPGEMLVIPDRLSSRGGRPRAELLSWREVNQLWSDHGAVKIMDVETRKVFTALRRGGYYHADIEPLTPEDTKILKEIYGEKWSWARRAVVVEINGRFIAASINGFPHGGEVLNNNGFPGHICLHFLGSRIHRSGRPDPEHQQMIRLAARTEL